jgi:hypothetical protein
LQARLRRVLVFFVSSFVSRNAPASGAEIIDLEQASWWDDEHDQEEVSLISASILDKKPTNALPTATIVGRREIENHHGDQARRYHRFR